MMYPRTFSAHQLPAYQRPGGYYYSQYRAGVRAPEPGPPPPPPPDQQCGPDMMWDPVLQSCVPVLPWPIQQSSVSGVSDITPWGLALPPLGAYQLFGGRGGKDSGWATTFALGAIVLAGVFGYFVYRNLIVAKAGLRGTGRAFGMGD